jgi:hypothetical protein
MNAHSPAVLAFFDGNSWWYNVLSFFVGVIGFVITIWQIVKTRKAAEAASDAARKTAEQLTKLGTLVDLTELCGFAREAITLFEHRSYYAASIRALDLRTGLAKVRESAAGKKLLTQQAWQTLVVKATSIHRVIVQRAGGGLEASVSDDHCHRVMSELVEELNGLAASAAQSVKPQVGEQI